MPGANASEPPTKPEPHPLGEAPAPSLAQLPLQRAVRARAPRTAASASRAIWNQAILNLELLGLLGVLLALCVWFSMSEPPEPPRRAAATPAAGGAVALAGVRLATPPPAPAYTFTTPRARDWLLPSILASAQPPQPAPEAAAPPNTPAVERHALLAEPLYDPLGAVIVGGLPPGTKISAGTTLSPTDWAVGFADLDNLVIRLPAIGAAPVRTTLDLRTREGVKIHSFAVELQQVAAVAGAPPAPALKKPKITPVKTERPRKVPRKKAPPAPEPRKAAAAPAPSPPPSDAWTEAAPAPPVPPLTPSAAPSGLWALLPFSYLKPDPKDSANAGLTPDLRDDPRFTTLRGLGMRPDDLPKPQNPAAPSGP